jgi:hypothetical protein
MTLHHVSQQPMGLLIALPAAIAAFTLGCGSQDEIRSYTVAKEVQTAAAEPQRAAPAGVPTHRMLGAILPTETGSWFFKAVGPIAAVDREADVILEFLESVRLKPDAAKPEWKLPEDWNEGGQRPMRVATLLIPADGAPIELAVSHASGSILMNVNRWRGQMKLPEVDENGLAKSVREIKAGDATMTIVDLRGRFDPGMMPPFAGGIGAATGARASGSVAAGSDANLPAGHPPIDATGGALPSTLQQSASADAPKFNAPPSWRTMPPSEIRKAAFTIDDGDKKAIVTVIDFRADAGPMIADPLQNVNQWRSAIGLAALDEAALKSVTESVEIDGKPATYARIVADASKPDESKIRLATLAAMVKVGERVWFFKMMGDVELVTSQENEFKSFLKSVRFAAERGARDGD